MIDATQVACLNEPAQEGAKAMALDQKTDPMQDFYRELENKSMDALWRRAQAGERPPDPVAPYQPARWRSADILPLMKRAGELVKPGPDSQRRVIQLVNPGDAPVRSAKH